MQQLLAALISAFLAAERRWTGDAAQGLDRPHFDLTLPQGLAPEPILHLLVCATDQTKTPRFAGLS